MTATHFDGWPFNISRSFVEKHGNPVTRSSFGGTLPLNAWTRTAPDLISGVLGGWGLDLPAGFEYTFDNATRHYWGGTETTPDKTQTGYTDSRETTTERINEIQSKHGWGLWFVRLRTRCRRRGGRLHRSRGGRGGTYLQHDPYLEPDGNTS